MLKIQEKFDELNIIKPMFKFKDDQCELTRQSLDYLGRPSFISISTYKQGYLLIRVADGRQKKANRVNYSNGAGIWRGDNKKQLAKLLKDDKKNIAIGQLSELKIDRNYEKCLLFLTK